MIKSWKIFRENTDAMGLFGIIFQYFLSNFDLDDDPTENDLDEKPSRENVFKQFKQPVRKLCAIFILSVIPIFDSFNTFLQAEEPLIHIYIVPFYFAFVSLITFKIHSTQRRILDVTAALDPPLLPEVISESDDVISIDVEDPDVLNDINIIFIGAMTK